MYLIKNKFAGNNIEPNNNYLFILVVIILYLILKYKCNFSSTDSSGKTLFHYFKSTGGSQNE